MNIAEKIITFVKEWGWINIIWLVALIINASALIYNYTRPDPTIKEDYLIAENERLQNAVDSLERIEHNYIIEEKKINNYYQTKNEKEIQIIYVANHSDLIDLRSSLRDSMARSLSK